MMEGVQPKKLYLVSNELNQFYILMDCQKYRPLIKLQHIVEHVFIPFEYSYSLAEIVRLKKYLPRIYSLFGVDAEQYSQSQHFLFEREKLKLKAVNGKSIVDEKAFRFYKESQLQTVSWNRTFISVDIPFNSRHSDESAKKQLQSKLEALLQKTLYFRNQTTKQIYRADEKVNCKINQIEPFFETYEYNPEAFDNSYRRIRCQLPVFVVLPKSQAYSLTTLSQYIRDDVANCLKIMIKHHLATRIIKSHNYLYLQSFVNSSNQRQAEQKKLLDLLCKRRELIVEQRQDQSEAQNVEVTTEASNRGLIAVLIALAVIYIYLKLNPLQKVQMDNSL